MTRTTNARLAGATYLFYIAVAFPSLILMERATSAEGIVAQLARVAQHTTEVRIAIVLTLLSALAALVLAVTLYAITRQEDPELAMLAMTCRVLEGVNSAFGLESLARLLWLATAAGVAAPDKESAHALGAVLLIGQTSDIGATFFAVGSTLFSYLLLRGRMIPAPLAWLGVAASVLLVVCLPLSLTGLLHGPITWIMWLPMLAFEVPLGFWLLIKGVAKQEPR
jgi:hypothetical protein